MIITIPNAEDEAHIRFLHDRAAFLGTGLRKRYSSEPGVFRKRRR